MIDTHSIGVGTVFGATYSGSQMLAQAVPNEWVNLLVQGGAVALLAIVLYHIFAKIIPALMAQRQKETQEFVEALKRITELHAASMDRARLEHRAEVAEIHKEAKAERIASDNNWRTHMTELTNTLRDMTNTIRGCAFNSKGGGCGGK